MTITAKLAKAVICESVGEDVIPVVSILKRRKEISENDLTGKLNCDINTTRRLLYKLYHKDLVNFERKKEESEGIYTYFWSFNSKRLGYLIEIVQKRKLEKLRSRVQREENSTFFLCPKYCTRFEFDQAIAYEYKCPECGALLEQEDNSERLTTLTVELQTLEKQFT